MARKVLGLGIGVAAFVLMALLPMTSWAGNLDITLGDNSAGAGGGEPNRMYVVRGADGVYYYTFEQLEFTAASLETLAGGGAFFPASSCVANPFQLSGDTNSNRFPDGTVFKSIPAGASGASDPAVSRIISSPKAPSGSQRTTVLIEVRGNDGDIYRNALDPSCDGVYAIGTFSSQAAGFGDTDRDAWPAQSSTASSWIKVTP